MTVQTTTNKVNHTGNGIVVEFAYDFVVPTSDVLFVFFDDVLFPSGYTVNDVGEPAGGTVTFDVAPDDGVLITLLRSMPETQQVNYIPYDPFPAETHEAALDKLTMLIQQLSEVDGRVMLAPVAGYPGVDLTMPPPVPLYVLGWAADGLSIVNYDITVAPIPGGQIVGAIYDQIKIVPVAANDITVNAGVGNVHLAFMNEDKLLSVINWPGLTNMQALTLLVTSQGTGHLMTYGPEMVGRDGTVGTLPNTTGLLSDETMVMTMTQLPNGSVVIDTYATNVGIAP